YHSPKRQRQAGATRRRILAAAVRLFAAQGYMTVTMEMIAREAKVALATVYLHFAGRAAMVGALAEEIAAAPELSVEQVEQVDEDAEPAEQVRIGARIMRLVNERTWLIAEILHSQQRNDPELARLWTLHCQRHLDAMRRAVSGIASRGGLRPELTVEAAADALYALAGTEVYRALALERDWSAEDYELWLFETACRVLLP
ncbi:MAG TPA: helix-turn-helix domain-containing protein, partial [Ktedonobacterales bacterium]